MSCTSPNCDCYDQYEKQHGQPPKYGYPCLHHDISELANFKEPTEAIKKWEDSPRGKTNFGEKYKNLTLKKRQDSSGKEDGWDEANKWREKYYELIRWATHDGWQHSKGRKDEAVIMLSLFKKKVDELTQPVPPYNSNLLTNNKIKIMRIRAKIQISSAFKAEGYDGEQIIAHAVYGNSTNAEDNTFSAATPSLDLRMWISNPAAIGRLEKGKKYYIDFTEAPE